MTRNLGFVALAAAAAAAVSALFASAPILKAKAAGDDIAVDLSERFQRLEGWEATIRAWEINKRENRYDPSFIESIDEVLGDLVEEAGVNRLRLEIRSGNESRADIWTPFQSGEFTHDEFEAQFYANENDNKDPFVADPSGFQWTDLDFRVENVVLPMRDLLAARGEKLFVNVCFVDFAKGNLGGLDLALKPEEYAELVAEAFKHLKSKYGLTPDAFEIVLEPENSGTWQAERIGPAVKAVRKRLKAEGFDPQIIAPSTKLAKNALYYYNTAMRSGADIDVIAYHSYDRPADTIRSDIARAAKDAGVKTAMLEHLRADVNEFYADMTIANVSAWQQWGIAHFNDGGKYLLVGDPTRPKGDRVRLGTRTRALSQIWRHARIGDVRVGARSADPALKPLAFVKPDGRAVLSVIADGPDEFSVSGLAPGTYSVERTTADVLAEKAGAVTVGSDGHARLSIPARGVVTIVQQK